MNKVVAVALLIGATMEIIPHISYAENINVAGGASNIYVNDEREYLTGYNINNNNYFQLRDLAIALKETPACFDIEWDGTQNKINVTTGKPYEGESGNSFYYFNDIEAIPTFSDLLIDGKTADITAYNVNDNNYYMLRDLSEYIHYDVEWVEESESVCIYTLDNSSYLAKSSGGIRRNMTSGKSTARWSSVINSYIYNGDADSFCVLDVQDNTSINVDYYNADTLNMLNSETIPMELDKFGGFYSGIKYNYIVFGQENMEEDDEKEVIRVVKYDKNFNRVDSCAVRDCYTTIPFAYGSLRMAEKDNELVIHTTRQRYLTPDDGLRHESQLTIVLDTDSMSLKNELDHFQNNHVSHSFIQSVCTIPK